MSTTDNPSARTHKRRSAPDQALGSSELHVALVGCGKAKLSARARARDLYIGVPFRLAMRYADLMVDDVHILSALHGLVAPHSVIAPYDFSMAQIPPYRHVEWGRQVLLSLRAAYPMQRLRVTFFAGKQYIRPIRAAITDEDRYWTFEDPLEGLDLFERIKWFKAKTPPF